MCSIIPTTMSLLHKLTPKRHNMIQGCLQARVSIFGHHNVMFLYPYGLQCVSCQENNYFNKKGFNHMIII
jgi:hypothetical protein